MLILVTFLVISCIIFTIFSVRPLPDGRAWSKWNAEKKYNYVNQYIASLRKKETIIKNPPIYYINELDIFYVKDESNQEYDVQAVILNLTRIHEYPQNIHPTKS